MSDTAPTLPAPSPAPSAAVPGPASNPAKAIIPALVMPRCLIFFARIGRISTFNHSATPSRFASAQRQSDRADPAFLYPPRIGEPSRASHWPRLEPCIHAS